MNQSTRYPVGVLSLKQEFGYAHIKLTVAWREPGKDDLFGYSGNPEMENRYGNLVSQCQMHPVDTPEGWSDPYGASLDYRGYEVMDLPKLETRAKFLRSVTKKIERIEAKYGPSYTFGVHANRVAIALGLKEIHLEHNSNAFKVKDTEHLVTFLYRKLCEQNQNPA